MLRRSASLRCRSIHIARGLRGFATRPSKLKPANTGAGSSKARTPAASITPAAAAGVLAGIAEAEAHLSFRDHMMRLGLWTVISLQVGAFFSSGDEGAQLLEHLDESVTTIITPSTSQTVLADLLERLSRGIPLNDTLKLRLLASPGFFDRLVEIVRSDRHSTTCRNHAVKALEALSGSADAQRSMIEHGHHVTLLELMGQPTTSLYARKALASAICNLAALSEHAESLCRAGAVGGLLKVQNSDPRVWRKRVDVTVARLSLEVVRHSPDALGQLKVEERDTIYKLAEGEAKQADSSPLHSVRASLIESGVLLYFHTAAGGAAWGLFESLRSQQPRAKLVQNVVRTSLVTCFVPILLVGGVVTSYNRINKVTDSIEEKFALYFGACVALYPASRLLSWVERFAPLWLGGHIVGFVSFFAWTVYSESDLLKSDRDLLGPPKNKKKAPPIVLWEAKPQANEQPIGPLPRDSSSG